MGSHHNQIRLVSFRLADDRIGHRTPLRFAEHRARANAASPGKRLRLRQNYPARIAETFQEPGENLSAAIGQGYVTVTPIQLANLIAAVSVSGKRFKPELIKALRNRSTGELTEFNPVPLKSVNVSPKSFSAIREALAGVVTDPEGTGHAARSDIVSIAGKTGTAQVIALSRGPKNEDQPKEFQDHAWFVAFAPVENPKIAICVLVEHGGHGGGAAAPLAKKVIEEYMKHDRSSNPDRL